MRRWKEDGVLLYKDRRLFKPRWFVAEGFDPVIEHVFNALAGKRFNLLPSSRLCREGWRPPE